MDSTAARRYRAIFFDLDGTLVPMEIDEFLGGYYAALGAFAEARGFDRDAFLAAVNAGVGAMMRHPDGEPNHEAFWAVFPRLAGAPESDLRAALEEFYAHDFGRIGDGVVPEPAARRVVETLAAKGYPLALATMPLFPRIAVEWRLRWAGVDPAAFSRITTYENSSSTKPRLAYYAENIAAFGVRGRDVLMVGNNTVEDLAICGLDADAYLVTGRMIDPVGLDLSTVRHGSIDELAAWAESLPPCAAPATGIDDGAVAHARAAAVLERDADPAALAAQEAAQRAAQAENDRLARGDAAGATDSAEQSAPVATGGTGGAL